MKLYYKFYIFFLVACACACDQNITSEDTRIGPAYELGDVPASILSVEAQQDPFQSALQVEMTELPGHDDLIFDPEKNVAYASGMDGWIWKLDFMTGKAAQWVRPPVNPAGMQFASRKRDAILVCASRLGGESYENKARVGLYEVEIATGEMQALVLDLPKTENGEFEKVYAVSERPTVYLQDLNPSNSRPFALCNDLAVSADAQRVYLTEPFERPDAAMGSGAVPEAIGLYPHGKLWLYDRAKESISLVLDGFTFVDGILLETDAHGAEQSVIFTETTKFRIMRAHIAGARQGRAEILFKNLPGLADGLERDAQGRIWTGIIKRRSGLINFVHGNPWTKGLLLSLPRDLLPISKETGILVLDPQARRPLYYVNHDGSRISDISVAVPFAEKGRVYFPSFDKSARGLFSLSVADLRL